MSTSVTNFSYTSPSGIQLSLANVALWQKFPTPMEMIIHRKNGRKLFPTLEYALKGLDEGKMYEVYLHMERVDNSKYKYTKNQWDDCIKGDPRPPIQKIKHKSGGQLGSHWMSRPISFEQIRLSNCPEAEGRDMVFVQSMHKWRPVVTIKELTAGSFENFEEVIRLEGTVFMAVTVYQNLTLRDAKTKNNKMAAGHREKRQTSKKLNSDDEAPPTKKLLESSSFGLYPTPPPTVSPPGTWSQEYNNSMGFIFGGASGAPESFMGVQKNSNTGFGSLGYGASGVPGAPTTSGAIPPFIPMWPNMEQMNHMGTMGQMPQMMTHMSHMGTINPSWNMGMATMGTNMGNSNLTALPNNNFDFCGSGGFGRKQ